ncbi:hypothetical protein, partial [Kistimonas scapharcae]|uniref:hypothetical protein n=1 Tax=Kistimonas scapharcae TaxID=1036133 RepID=UPI0031EA6592
VATAYSKAVDANDQASDALYQANLADAAAATAQSTANSKEGTLLADQKRRIHVSTVEPGAGDWANGDLWVIYE